MESIGKVLNEETLSGGTPSTGAQNGIKNEENLLTLDNLARPVYKKSTSSGRFAQLPQLDTELQASKDSLQTPTSILTSASASGHPTLANQPQFKVQPITSTPLSASSSRQGSISFQVEPNQKIHRGSISARPSSTKLPIVESSVAISTSTGVPSSRTPSNSKMPGNFLANEMMHKVVKSPTLETVAASPALHKPIPNIVSFDIGVSPSHSIKTPMTSPPSLVPQSSPQHSLDTPLSAHSNGSQNSLVKKKQTTTTKALVTEPVGPPVPFTQYLSKEDDGKIHILIGASGSVATIKIPLIIDKLFKIYGVDKVSIQIVVTETAEHFLRGLKISTEVKIWRENEEWANPKTKPGDPILHLELRKWADVFLIAPLSANTLAKIANGLADNLLTSIIRVWNPSVPILVAPAMNTFMYKHPVTKRHLQVLKEDFPYVEVLRPIEKVLVCGDIGMGGMREWSEIVDITVRKIREIQKKKKEEEGEQAGEDDEDDEDDDEDDEDYDDEDEDEDEDDDEDDDDEEEEDEEDEDTNEEVVQTTYNTLKTATPHVESPLATEPIIQAGEEEEDEDEDEDEEEFVEATETPVEPPFDDDLPAPKSPSVNRHVLESNGGEVERPKIEKGYHSDSSL